MRKLGYFVIAAFLAVALLAGTAATAQAAEYYLIVNAANDTSADKDVVKRLFLKQQTSWPNGVSADPFDRSEGDAARNAFLQNVLGMTETELNAHWLQLKQTKGETPPRQVGSDNIIVRAVATKEGAFGFVDDASSLPADVKVLFTFSG